MRARLSQILAASLSPAAAQDGRKSAVGHPHSITPLQVRSSADDQGRHMRPPPFPYGVRGALPSSTLWNYSSRTMQAWADTSVEASGVPWEVCCSG